MLSPEQYSTDNVHGHTDKSEGDHHQKYSIIIATHTVIDPHAVMIKFLHTSPTRSTMPRTQLNIAATDITI